MIDKILYVEDDLDTREEISFFLKNRTKELLIASNGDEGLKLFEKYNPSLVITDINMPNMGGLEMARRIKNINETTHIILLTAYNDAKKLHQAITIGIKEYLVKPIDFKELLRKIDFFDEVLKEQKEKAEKYRLLEDYRYAVDKSTIFIKLDSSGALTYVNSAFCDILQYEQDKLQGHFLSDFGLPYAKQNHILKSIKNEGRWSGRFELTSKDCLTITVDCHFFALQNPHGSTTDVIGILHDITEVESLKALLETKLDETEDTLKEQNHYISEYDNVLEQGLAMCRLDNEGRILRTSIAFRKLFGFQDAIQNKKSIHTVLGWTQNNFSTILQTLKLKNIYKDTIKVSLLDTVNIINMTCIGMFGIDGEIKEVVLVFEDVTDFLEQHKKLDDMQIEFLYMLSEIIEKHSEEAGFHTKRVSEYSAMLAKAIGLDKDEVEQIRLAAIMHDIGKIGIPYNILVKRGALDSRERLIMQRHPKIGYDILSNAQQPLLQAAAIIAHEHHERWDGNGYPRGLKKEEIHIYGRIVSIADVFDALSKQRVYKKAWSIEDVYGYLEVNRGIQFDPDIIDTFLSLKPMVESIRNNY